MDSVQGRKTISLFISLALSLPPPSLRARPSPANGYDRPCVYTDGDIKDLGMADLVRLAKLDPNDVGVGVGIVPNKKPRLSIKLNAKQREG